MEDHDSRAVWETYKRHILDSVSRSPYSISFYGKKVWMRLTDSCFWKFGSLAQLFGHGLRLVPWPINSYAKLLCRILTLTTGCGEVKFCRRIFSWIFDIQPIPNESLTRQLTSIYSLLLPLVYSVSLSRNQHLQLICRPFSKLTCFFLGYKICCIWSIHATFYFHRTSAFLGSPSTNRW